MYSPQPLDFFSVSNQSCWRQWIKEIFDFRFLICDLVPAPSSQSSIADSIGNQKSKIKNQKSKRLYRFEN